jgi:hypothetical protein
VVSWLQFSSVTASISREEIVGVFDALEADFDRALTLSFDVLTTPERLAMLQLCEKMRRQLPAVEHPLINQVGDQADATHLPPPRKLLSADEDDEEP